MRKPEGRFKWFLASILFAKRISSDIAKRTFRRFEENSLTSPKAILDAGWDKLVQVLDSGGYVRYDFSTASNLLAMSRDLLERYGSLEEIHARADGPRQLEKMLMQFKGVGPVGVNIFLRELRGEWKKANPIPSKLALETARRLRIRDANKVESQLVRIKLEYCKKAACKSCPVRQMCQTRKNKKGRRHVVAH